MFLAIFKGVFGKFVIWDKLALPKKITAPLNFEIPKSEKISAPLNFGELKICEKLKKILAPFKGGGYFYIGSHPSDVWRICFFFPTILTSFIGFKVDLA